MYRGGIQIAFDMENKVGIIKDITDFIRDHGAIVMSVLSSYDIKGEGRRNVYFRIEDMADDRLTALVAELRENFNLLFVVRDDLSDL